MRKWYRDYSFVKQLQLAEKTVIPTSKEKQGEIVCAQFDEHGRLLYFPLCRIDQIKFEMTIAKPGQCDDWPTLEQVLQESKDRRNKGQF